jgi:anti-sigma factor RsiW
VSNKTMNCGQVKRLMPPYLDEELSGRVRDGVSAHLASCPACHHEMEALKADVGLLELAGTPEVTPFLVTRVMAEIRHLREPSVRRWFALRRALSTFAAAIVVAVGIGAGIFFGTDLAATPRATDSVQSAVTYVESSTTDMYSLMAGGD